MKQPDTTRDDRAARLAAIVESSDDAIVSKDLRGVVTSWNPAAEKLFGYSAAEAIGRSITELIIPADRLHEERDILARIGRGEAVEHFETVRRTKGGQLVHVSVTSSPVRNAAGEVIGASKVARDITEQRRADEIRARLAAIVESSDDAIISKTLDGIIRSWNPGAEKIFGYSAAEAIGQHIRLIIPRDHWAEEDGVLARVAHGERVEHFDTIRVARDGRRIDVSLTVSPVRNAAGDIIGASKIGRDVTERRRAEAERAELLASEQAAREEAETVNRSKDQFLAVLSHELRTPLNAIFGWARMIHDGRIDAALVARGTQVILRNATAQLKLVEDLLDMSRIITGNMRLEVRAVDVKEVVEAALDTVRPAVTAKELRLTAVLATGDGAVVLGAPDRLQQVVWNLVMNAVKFTPKGGRIEVVVRRIDSHVAIVVSDTGEGIAPELLPHIFERFRQGDSSSTRAHGGLGIGLALVRHLVELHGGSVRAESEGVGLGATFTVKLPVALAKSSQDASVPTGPPRTPSLGTLRDIRVLVVDDDLDSVDLARIVLGDAGAEVQTCTSGPAATEILRGWPADILVFDIEMPGEDGYALLRRVRAEESQGQRTPAIALTAYGNTEDRKRAFAAGFNLYLAKPIDPSELTMAIATLAGRR